MSKVVYMVWESEDEGHRFVSPRFDHAFKKLKTAKECAINLAKAKVECDGWKGYIDELCLPPVGHVIAVYGDTKKMTSMKVALNQVRDKESLYAIDWTFVMGVEVIDD